MSARGYGPIGVTVSKRKLEGLSLTRLRMPCVVVIVGCVRTVQKLIRDDNAAGID